MAEFRITENAIGHTQVMVNDDEAPFVFIFPESAFNFLIEIQEQEMFEQSNQPNWWNS
ncbi:hypothetical protein SCRM01_271 [Synechococcus phage S-CRM01]|uniref:hypothetical protein n=1 Tax=Synechococcus phage S-CRM01 TaxID=1026955 RepID=UPI000209E30B|nr:hypothetical protein SCRM01_271 [Synechococcus phage S-CRM01]AEC53217.1 hypothetical protein SCRM01_271 [Synechococcus phage S-CRM01]